MEKTVKKLAIKKEMVEYLQYYLTKPENLIGLSTGYQKEAGKLLKNLITNPNGPILFKRIWGNLIVEKVITGTAKNIAENHFTFTTFRSLEDETIYEELHDIHIRTDNVLGWIPFLPSIEAEKINPFENHICDETREYFVFLADAKKIFLNCVGEKHRATLCLRDGGIKKEVIDCAILQANKSNIEVKHYRSVIYENGKPVSITLSGAQKIILFLSPKSYLQKVEVSFGQEHTISPYDDGEEF